MKNKNGRSVTQIKPKLNPVKLDWLTPKILKSTILLRVHLCNAIYS